jgi:hypothetical protein
VRLSFKLFEMQSRIYISGDGALCALVALWAAAPAAAVGFHNYGNHAAKRPMRRSHWRWTVGLAPDSAEKRGCLTGLRHAGAVQRVLDKHVQVVAPHRKNPLMVPFDGADLTTASVRGCSAPTGRSASRCRRVEGFVD